MEKQVFDTRLWIKIALINFCVVALAGVTLRYKINFPLPALNQKYLLHAHSHFAFVGFVTLALMALMVRYLLLNGVVTNYRKYHWVLLANCLTAYAMIVSFTLEGYAAFSITFSTLSILVSYFFIGFMWRDLGRVPHKAHVDRWFRAALILWAISSLGAFSLAYLMANQIMIQDLYFSAIYFFLHFQYNGWFLFVCFGLFFSWLQKQGVHPAIAVSRQLFLIMAITVGPSYLLSIIWLKLPIALIWIGNISGIFQLLVLFYFIRLLTPVRAALRLHNVGITRLLWILVAVAFILKIILQLLSIFPYLGQFAFGYRPVIIGYLHLSFLGVISFFIVGYINQWLIASGGRGLSRTGIIIFITGVLMQEIVLMLQGLEALEVHTIRQAPLILFGTAVIILLGLLMIAFNSLPKLARGNK